MANANSVPSALFDIIPLSKSKKNMLMSTCDPKYTGNNNFLRFIRKKTKRGIEELL